MKTSGKIMSASFAGILTLFLICNVACNTDKIYQEEQYKTIVYLLSGSENVYTESYTLNETEPVKYFSIGYGGSNSNEEEIVVTLEPDNVLLDQYNRSNFDSKDSYAKILPASRYKIDSYTITIPAKLEEQYVKVPVKVTPLGLSPDTVYFIPLAIKSVSRYGVNEDKYNMLYRVTIENDYARQKVTTYYTKKGTVRNQSNNSETILSGSKIVQPLTKNEVRMYTGNNTQGYLASKEDIDRYSIVVRINADQTVGFAPYGNIEVEKLEAEGYNIYNPKVMRGTKAQRVLYLYYRYRIQNNDGSYGAWMEVKETLTRIEEI
jgi:hypothetical protein